MVLAVYFLAVVDERRSNPLNFVMTEIRILARILRSLMQKYALRQRRQNLDSLPEVNFLPQVYGL